MYSENENNFNIQNEFIDLLDKEYIFTRLDNMSQLKILTYLLPYEIHRLSKKTYTKKIKKKIFKRVKRKRKVPIMKWNNEKNDFVTERYDIHYSTTRRKLTDEENKKYNGKKNINLFFKNMRLSYKFIYHKCKSKCCREAELNDTNYKLWDDVKAMWVLVKPKNNFYSGFCSCCELYKKNIHNNRNMRYFESNGKCLLLDSSDEE